MKATNEQIISAYQSTGSVWQAAKLLGMGGQSIWERLRALDYPLAARTWSKEEVEELRRIVPTMTLTDIATRLGRPYAGVACMASRLGIGTRVGNRIKRKVPRGSGLTKQVVSRLLEDIKAWDGSLRQFCRGRGLSIDVFAAAVQKYDPDTWRTIAWQRGLAEKECPECGTIFYPMNAKQIGCTRRCTSNYRSNQTYFGGKRQLAIGMREKVCQLCLKQKSSLSAHHALGKEHDAENEFLIALCSGCHRLVSVAASMKMLDSEDGWERLIELVMARRLAGQEGAFAGTHVSVDMEYLAMEELVDYGLLAEPVSSQE